MRIPSKAASLFLLLAVPRMFAADCIPYTEAPKKIDENACVTGKVVKVSSSGKSGTQFINFCEDYHKCPFSVVVFSRDLPDVGDVRALEGQTIEIHGRIKEYHGQAEMILNDVKQLSGAVTKLPPLPKNYDVENRGKYSPGQYGTPKKPKQQKRDKPESTEAHTDAPPPGT